MSHTVLLDTHALLWYDTEPERIPAPVLALLQRQGTHILVSAVSVLELAIKFRLGKLPQAAGLIRNYGALMTRYGFQELPLNGLTALEVASLATTHSDPFDRVLAAQALMLDVPLVSRDPAFTAIPDLRTIW